MNRLFEVPELKIEKGKRCRNCKHLFNHQWGKMKYCGKQFSNRTGTGYKKIKANDCACIAFEPINPQHP